MCLSCGCGKPNDDHGDQSQYQPVGSDQPPSQQNNYGQTHNQPGTYAETPGHEGGTAWRQDLEDVNYQPPDAPST